MNSDFQLEETGVNIEDYCRNFRVSRHFFKWNESNRYLVRAYCYPPINIIIISHIQGEIIFSKEKIIEIFQKIKLKQKKTILITHIKNKFYKRSVSSNLQQLDDVEEKISLDMVEELILDQLEPIETWLEIDVDIHRKNELRRQEANKKLLQLYLEPDLKFLISVFEKKEYDFEQIEYQYSRYREPNIPLRGALFYYPEIKQENQQKYTYFFKKQDLENSYESNRLALKYVNNYDVRTEVAGCLTQVPER